MKIGNKKYVTFNESALLELSEADFINIVKGNIDIDINEALEVLKQIKLSKVVRKDLPGNTKRKGFKSI